MINIGRGTNHKIQSLFLLSEIIYIKNVYSSLCKYLQGLVPVYCGNILRSTVTLNVHEAMLLALSAAVTVTGVVPYLQECLKE